MPVTPSRAFLSPTASSRLPRFHGVASGTVAGPGPLLALCAVVPCHPAAGTCAQRMQRRALPGPRQGGAPRVVARPARPVQGQRESDLGGSRGLHTPHPHARLFLHGTHEMLKSTDKTVKVVADAGKRVPLLPTLDKHHSGVGQTGQGDLPWAASLTPAILRVGVP